MSMKEAVKHLSELHKDELKKLGKKLAKTSDRKIIEDITHILSQYSDVPYERISAEYNDIVKNRLENV